MRYCCCLAKKITELVPAKCQRLVSGPEAVVESLMMKARNTHEMVGDLPIQAVARERVACDIILCEQVAREKIVCVTTCDQSCL